MAAPIATFKPELKAAARQDGTRAVRIRITKFRKHAYWNLGKYILPSQWNPKPSPKLHNYVQRHPDAPDYNNEIKKALSGLGKIADTLPAGSAVEIKEAYENHLNPKPEAPKQQNGFFVYFAEYIERIKAINPGTFKSYRAILNSFQKFTGPGLPDEQILAPALLHRYRIHLAETLQPSTIKTRFDTLLIIYKNGVMEGRIKQVGNPLKSIRVIVPEKIQPRPDASVITKLLNLSPTKPNQRRARLAALLQYFLHGARISEVLTLEWDKHVLPDKVVFLPVKRASKLKTVPRGPVLNWLLSQFPKTGRYVLPFLSDTDGQDNPMQLLRKIQKSIFRINYALQQIAEAEKWGIKLSSHMMRRAFLDKVMAETDDLMTAQSMAGHSSAKTTEGYLKAADGEKLKSLSTAVYNAFTVPDETGKQKDNI